MTPASLPRCWADGGSGLSIDRPIECQALGTDRLGLCPRHAEEIIGDPTAAAVAVVAQGVDPLAQAS